jgi:hypothetical protein
LNGQPLFKKATSNGSELVNEQVAKKLILIFFIGEMVVLIAKMLKTSWLNKK